MQLARTVGRITIGGLFVAHGTQKLFGWFGGPGLDGTEGMMTALGYHPPRQQAVTAGVVEAGAGALLALGLGTPLAAAGLTGVMASAVRDVHASKGLWNSNGGYEYNLVLVAALADLAEGGPGELSLDRALGIERRGARWAVGAVALGVSASFLNAALSRRLRARQQDGTDDDTATA
ncbi:DoxX family protein [Isoptericola sp. F-RaC21]|uniref:DoxX family protein n=1 Tax=Isoptericola sp. F-RaC21 TaxID=3141452 RepID=UPI00315B4783